MFCNHVFFLLSQQSSQRAPYELTTNDRVQRAVDDLQPDPNIKSEYPAHVPSRCCILRSAVAAWRDDQPTVGTVG
jgi:hypothetical protein